MYIYIYKYYAYLHVSYDFRQDTHHELSKGIASMAFVVPLQKGQGFLVATVDGVSVWKHPQLLDIRIFIRKLQLIPCTLT